MDKERVIFPRRSWSYGFLYWLNKQEEKKATQDQSNNFGFQVSK